MKIGSRTFGGTMKQKLESTRRRSLVKLISGSALLVGPSSAVFGNTALLGFRMVQQENVMLHFDLDHVVTGAKLFALSNPERLVIDLPGTALSAAVGPQEFAQGAVKGIRFGVHNDKDLRIVVDLHRPVAPSYHVVNRQGGQRLIIDLGVKGNPELVDYKARLTEPSQLRDVIVAIDAGHGGKDPGAIGQRKTQEKDITLKVAQRLYKRLQKQEGIKPVLIRRNDTYIALRERIRLAREKNADLFVSIHADAFKRKAAKGSSVFTLSLKGASSEAAQWLADKENEADALFGDIALDGLSQDLKETLLDLAQNSTLEASLEVGDEVLSELKKIGSVHKPQVEQANFAVLKSPDIPSVLVETAFISNLSEEKKLNSPRFQEKLAKAIQTGVAHYLARRAPEGTALYAKRGTG
jgi:N-acetylmuramoyl-L-alanine amidase